MKLSIPRYKILTFFFLVALVSSSRFWEFGSSDSHEVKTLPIIVFVVRIFPLLIMLFFLFFDDLLNQLKGILSLTKALFAALSIHLLVSFYSSITVYGEIYSAWKTTEILIITYLGACMLSAISNHSLDIKQQYILRKFFNVVLGILISIILSSILFYDIAFRFSGVQMEAIFPPMNSNSLGSFALTCLLFYYFVPYKNSNLKWFAILTSFSFLILSVSRTSYIALIAIIILFVFRAIAKLIVLKRVHARRFFSFSAILLFVSFFMITNFTKVVENVTKGQSTEQLSELSHRVFTWQAATLSIKQKPYFGYGLVAETRKLVEKYPFLVTYKQDSIGNAHSSIFESLLASGFLGAGFYLLMLFYMSIRSGWYIIFSFKNPANNAIQIFASCFMIGTFFRLITGSALTMLSFDFITMVLLYSIKAFPWQKK